MIRAHKRWLHAPLFTPDSANDDTVGALRTGELPNIVSEGSCEKTPTGGHYEAIGRHRFRAISIDSLNRGVFMKRIFLLISVLVLSAGVISGCAEDKKPVEKSEKAVEAVEGIKEKEAVTKEEPAGAAQDEKEVKIKEEVSEAAVEVKEKAAEVEKGVPEEVARETGAAPAGTVKVVVGAGPIFKAKCGACHGADGQGTSIAPAFKGNEWIKNSSAGDIAGTIKNGREGAEKRYKNFPMGMPAQKSLPDAEVDALVEHLKGMASK